MQQIGVLVNNNNKHSLTELEAIAMYPLLKIIMIIKSQGIHQGKIPSINSVKLEIHPMRKDLTLNTVHFVVK
jgi:hypothetical protein